MKERETFFKKQSVVYHLYFFKMGSPFHIFDALELEDILFLLTSVLIIWLWMHCEIN